MKQALFVAGPALGHISRLLTIADALSLSDEVEIRFVVPASTSFAHIIEGAGYGVTLIPVRSAAFPFSGFEEKLEEFLSERTFDVVVCDLQPMAWQSTMRWPGIPRILITNVFLTRRDLKTVQFNTFGPNKEKINEVRRSKGLVELESHDQLYEADEVLFADPSQVVELFCPLNENQSACGACFWALKGDLPTELMRLERPIVASMGSTGRASLGPKTLTEIAKYCSCEDIVYVGPSAPETDSLNITCHCYGQLPLEPLLKRAPLVIAQGGSGSTYQALAFGAPVVVIPTNRNHAILGQQLEALGVGVLVENEGEVERLTDFDFDTLSVNAAEFATRMGNEVGPSNAAKKISRWIR